MGFCIYFDGILFWFVGNRKLLEDLLIVFIFICSFCFGFYRFRKYMISIFLLKICFMFENDILLFDFFFLG